jgi:ubiquinone/menaquinone biosynthesis C-methylase UbiE
LGELDPFWAILSEPHLRYGKWDIKRFLQTGNDEVKALMAGLKALDYPKDHLKALDFGCGSGRITLPLSSYFEESYGVDISDPMIKRARILAKNNNRCKYFVNKSDDLKMFKSASFDLVYSFIVLQHVGSKELVFSYLREFLRVLKKGGIVVFQIPVDIPLKHRLQPKSRLYKMLRDIGFANSFLYKNLGLFPITMTFVPENELLEFLGSLGAEVIKKEKNTNKSLYENVTYYVVTG